MGLPITTELERKLITQFVVGEETLQWMFLHRSGMSLREIGDRYGVTHGTVQHRIGTAMKKLRAVGVDVAVFSGCDQGYERARPS